MKKCFKCNEVKPLTKFHKDKQNTDGHKNTCKPCRKKADAERIKARGPKPATDYKRQYRKDYPGKYKAQNAVSNAVSNGTIDKPVLCSSCGIYTKPHAHHDDYKFKLTVRWLCVECHHQWHAINGEAPNGRVAI